MHQCRFNKAFHLMLSGLLAWSQDIENATKIPASDLKRTMQSLACGHFKLLVKNPKGKEVKEDDSFSFNSQFTHKMIKFKVCVCVAS